MTLGASVPSAVMIWPPYECPATRVGPSWRRSTRRSRSTSSASLVRPNWGAVTLYPSACSCSMTAFQLEPSAQAPCTRTMLGSEVMVELLLVSAFDRSVQLGQGGCLRCDSAARSSGLATEQDRRRCQGSYVVSTLRSGG